MQTSSRTFTPDHEGERMWTYSRTASHDSRRFGSEFIYSSLSDSIDDFHCDSSYPVKQSIQHSPTTIKRLQHNMQHRYIQHNHNQSFPVVNNDVNTTHRSASSTISASPTNVIRRKRVMRILEDLHSKQREINGKNRLKYRKYPDDNVDGRRKLTKTVSGRTLLELQIPTAQGNANDIYCSNSYGSILHSK